MQEKLLLCALACPLFIYFIFLFIFPSFILSLMLDFKEIITMQAKSSISQETKVLTLLVVI